MGRQIIAILFIFGWLGLVESGGLLERSDEWHIFQKKPERKPLKTLNATCLSKIKGCEDTNILMPETEGYVRCLQKCDFLGTCISQNSFYHVSFTDPGDSEIESRCACQRDLTAAEKEEFAACRCASYIRRCTQCKDAGCKTCNLMKTVCGSKRLEKHCEVSKLGCSAALSELQEEPILPEQGKRICEVLEGPTTSAASPSTTSTTTDT